VGNLELELGLPRRVKKALEAKRWTSRMEAHDHKHQLNGVTSLLKQHSFGFRAVSCVVSRDQQNHISSSQNPSIHKESWNCTGPILVFCRLAHVFPSSGLLLFVFTSVIGASYELAPASPN